MAFKFVCFAALVAAASAGYGAPAGLGHYGATAAVAHYGAPAAVAHYGAPVAVAKYAVAAPVYKTVVAEHEAPAEYDFHYSVEDAHTGDVKSQQESRKGDVFHGQYTLLEADGQHRRTVDYAGDEHSGFNADFSYAVEDPHTGDSKSQQESRKGDAVHGQYSLIDADGYRRVVEYTADDHSGFQAVVHREPVQGHVAKVATPVQRPVAYHAAPVAYHGAKIVAPVAKIVAPVAYAAPVAHYSAPAAQQGHGHGYGHNTVSYSAPASNYHY